MYRRRDYAGVCPSERRVLEVFVRTQSSCNRCVIVTSVRTKEQSARVLAQVLEGCWPLLSGAAAYWRGASSSARDSRGVQKTSDRAIAAP